MMSRSVGDRGAVEVHSGRAVFLGLFAVLAWASFGCSSSSSGEAPDASNASVDGAGGCAANTCEDVEADTTAGGEGGALFASGTRLRARVQVPTADGGDDAAAIVLGWHDQLLDIDCQMVKTTDGAYQCLPTQYSVQRVFSTPTCEPGSGVARIFQPSGFDCSVGFGAFDVQTPACEYSTVSGVVALGQAIPGSIDTYGYIRTVAGECNQLRPPPGGENPWTYCEVSDVDMSMFVSAEVTERDVGQVRQRRFRTEDGASAVLVPLLDPALGVSLYAEDDQLLPLVPSFSGAGFELFSDAACTERALCASPQCVNVVISRPACVSTAYRLTDTVSTVYGPGPDHCAAQSPPQGDGIACYAQVEALAKIPYTKAKIGSGRLRALWIEHGGEAVEPSGWFYDEVLDTTCWTMSIADGSLRCVPIGQGYQWPAVFSDATCDTRVGYELVGECLFEPPAFATFTAGDVAQEVWRMTPVNVSAPSVTYTRNGQPEGGKAFNCTARPDNAPYYASQPIALDTLAEVSERVE
jgi:hypothetical protein